MSDRGGRGGRGGGGRGGGGRGGGGGGYQGGGGRGGGGGGGGGGGYQGGRGGRGGGGRGGKPIVVFRDPNVTEPLATDQRVTAIENAYAANSKGISAAMAQSSLSQKLPKRPGFGTQGQQILVYANYFKITAPPNLTLTRYNVEISPAVTGKKMARVFQLLLGMPEFDGVVTEYKSMIVSTRTLNIPDPYIVPVRYLVEGQEEAHERSPTYNVRVTTPLSFSINDLINYLASESPTATFPSKIETIQVLNVVFGHYPQSAMDIASMGGNRHYSVNRNIAHNIRTLGGGLEALRGYFQSVRPATGGLLLNVNVAHNVFLEPERLDRMFNAMGSGNKSILQTKIKGKRVSLTHLPPRKDKKTGKQILRCKTIFALASKSDGVLTDPHRAKVTEHGAGPKDVSFWLNAEQPSEPTAGKAKAKAPKSGPPLPSNTYISVFDYFKKKYPQQKLDPLLPVVNVGNRENPSYLPAEVCVLVAGQPISRRLSPEQTKEMILFACRRPDENAMSIVGDGKQLLGLNQPGNRFGLVVGKSLMVVEARVLAPPPVQYKNYQAKPTSVITRGGSWNMINVRFQTSSNLGQWTFIRFRSNRRSYRPVEMGLVEDSVFKFRDFLNKAGINAGGLIPGPPEHMIEPLVDGDDNKNYDTISNTFRILHGNPEKRPRFVLVVIPYNDTPMYNYIKTIADTKAGIHTVCVVESKFVKVERQDQYFGNISLKFNLKAGGINHTLEPSKLGVISEGKTMVVGIDVTHPSPGSVEGAPSVAGVVASIDKVLGQWPSVFAIQDSKAEMVAGLEGMILTRLDLWEKHNRTLPENILVYRDGVSEGQFTQVLDKELPLIRNACRQKYPATATKQGFPKISIIICGKRHHTRFFPSTEAGCDRSSNCLPGTVVDRGVTEADSWDFFVQAHSCLQGTARPCHYTVILDEIFRGRKPKPPHQNTADTLEDLTHNMSYLFGRATKAVSLCPPAYYADLLCTRLRCYLSKHFEPPSASVSVSSSAARTTASESLKVQIPPTMSDSMFYI